MKKTSAILVISLIVALIFVLVACGNGTKDETMEIAVGDQVLYGKYAGTEVEFEGVKYLIMRQSDVLAILG